MCNHPKVLVEMPSQIDPGNEVSKPKPHTLHWVADFIRRHPTATTGQGEAGLLVAEIDRLQAEVDRFTAALAKANFGRNINDF